MLKTRPLPVILAAAAAFMVGAVWYSPLLFGGKYMELRGMDPNAAAQMSMQAGELLGEFARWLVVAYVLSRFIGPLGIADLKGALVFGGWMWIAIYTALIGSVLHEGAPLGLYAIHAGDGLVKVLLIASILGAHRAR